jgi:hypothetical protein
MTIEGAPKGGTHCPGSSKYLEVEASGTGEIKEVAGHGVRILSLACWSEPVDY